MDGESVIHPGFVKVNKGLFFPGKDRTSFPPSSVQISLVAQLCLTLCDPTDCNTPGSPAHPNSQSLLKLMSIESMMPSNHLILYLPFLLLPSVFPRIRVFSKESVLRIGWPKYWSFSFSIKVHIQGWFPLELTDLIPLQSKGLSRVFSNTTV